MSRQDVTITTADGQCPAYFFTPSSGNGPWPGVIFYMDALAIRPTLFQMAQDMADKGYAVLLPDFFYREGGYEEMVPSEVFTDKDKLATLYRLVGSIDRARTLTDAKAYIAYMHGNEQVKKGALGLTGYCMGGKLALNVAAAFPNDVAAIASYHGGGMATDDQDSPVHHVGTLKAAVYVAGADKDDHFDAKQKEWLEKALTDAGVEHTVTIYADAMHGFAVYDHPSFSKDADAKHWDSLTKLFGAKL